MIQVVVFFEINDGHADSFVAEFAKVAPLVRGEDGCICYDLSRDLEHGLDVAVPPRGNVFTLHEKWESLAHLKAHLAIDHMTVFREAISDAVAGAAIYVNEPVDCAE